MSKTSAALPPQPMLPIRKHAERHGVHDRTIKNWSAAGILPRIVRINGRLYLPASAMPRLDASPKDGS